MIHNFSVGYTFEDKIYNSVDIPLERLVGEDIQRILKQWRTAGNMVVIPVLDASFCALCAAAAAHLPIEFFERMPARDYLMLTQAVSNFFLGSD